MKKKTILYSLFVMSGVFISFEALTNATGAPAGSTGSPLSGGRTCAQSGCHLGGPSVTTQTIAVTHDIPSSGFLANTNYNFTVTLNDGGAGSSKMGFQASIEGGGTHAGTLSVNSNPALTKKGSYITHSNSGTAAPGGSRSWNFVWNSGNAPDASVMYVAGNFTNSNGTTTGDVITTQTLILTKDQGISLKEESEVIKPEISPNPAADWVYLKSIPAEVNEIKIISLDGKVAGAFGAESKTENGSWELNTSELPSGQYLIIPGQRQFKPRQLIISR